MSDSTNSQSRLYVKMYRALVGIAALCGIIIVIIYQFTAPIIEDNKQRALESAVFKLLPEVESKKIFYIDDTGKFLTHESQSKSVIYAAYDSSKQLTGFVIPASGMGYQDTIQLLYAYMPKQQTIVGLHILQSRETPGLGNRIEFDPVFLKNFNQLDVKLNAGKTALSNKITMVKTGKKNNPWEIDAISGATISSKSVSKIIQQSATYWLPKIIQNYEIFEHAN